MTESDFLYLFLKLPRQLAVWVCEVKQRLDDLRGKDLVLLPQVEHPDDPRLFFLAALIQVVEGDLRVLGKPGRKHVLVRAKLVAGLTHYRVDDVEAGDLVLCIRGR